jgi:hypothetical protein
MVRIDAPCSDLAATPHGEEMPCTFEARLGEAVVGVASVSRYLPPGPPLRGVYRIHDVAARAGNREQHDGTRVIARCIVYAAAGGGRTLWCHATLATVDIWRRYGFSVAGAPIAVRGADIVIPMVRRLAPARRWPARTPAPAR